MSTSEKSLVKDVKMLVIEEHFNEEIEDILWRLRQCDRKEMDDIARLLSVDGVCVSVEDVATWLNYLEWDALLPIKLVKPDPAKVPPPPKHTRPDKSDKMFDPTKTPSVMCDDKCVAADRCKFYAMYYGKRCVVDVQTKQSFLAPLKGYIEKNYARDADVQQIFTNFADQIATMHQIMQRKVRHLNSKGITLMERKIDPQSGKMVENEVPNPLAGDILQDAKAIMSMLKEMGLTPKSATHNDASENDLASLSKAMQIAESKERDLKHVTELKQDRYRKRGVIESKDQLLALLDEKDQFDNKLKRVLEGDDEAPPANIVEEVPDNEAKNEDPDKVFKRRPSGVEVDIPDDVRALLENMNKKEP